MATFQRLQDADLAGKSVFLRLDLNVPMKDGKITDETRIREALPTVRYILEKTNRLVVASHFGRPKEGFEKKYSLETVAHRLAELLEREVVFVNDYYDEPADQLLKQLDKNQFIVLENLRFAPGETKNSEDFAEILMKGIQIYVNDAFGAAHRAHASIVAAAEQVPADRRYAGFLMEREISALDKLKQHPEAPYTVVMGGAKVSDKIGVILNLLNDCNHMVFGGALAYTFLYAMGKKVGSSRVETDKLHVVESILERAKARNVTLHFPVDHVASESFAETASPVPVNGPDIPEGLMGLDIGPQTVALYKSVLRSSKTVLWNGPMGVFEWPAFANGSLSIAREIAELRAYTVVGGGESVAAVGMAGVADKISHVSTGGGASLEFLEGLPLPGVKVLSKE